MDELAVSASCQWVVPKPQPQRTGVATLPQSHRTPQGLVGQRCDSLPLCVEFHSEMTLWLMAPAFPPSQHQQLRPTTYSRNKPRGPSHPGQLLELVYNQALEEDHRALEQDHRPQDHLSHHWLFLHALSVCHFCHQEVIGE